MIDFEWELLNRYLTGRCTPTERAMVDRWREASVDNREALDALRLAMEVADETAAPEREAEVLASLRRTWGTAAPAKTSNGRSRPLQLVPGKPRHTWRATTIKAAAAVLVVGSGVFGGLTWMRSSAMTSGRTVQAAAIAVSTARGERRALTLSDGTMIMLAPASTLRWSPDYGVKDRVVELDGEAMFTVTHDTNRPFAVRTPQALARDLGTRFIVRSYPGDTITDVVVAEGVVAVMPMDATPSSATDSVVLRRGDRALVRGGGDAGSVTVHRDVMIDDAFAWANGRLVFRDVMLRDAVATLSRWYDLDIQYDVEAVGDRVLSASFQDEPGVEAMRVVAAILNLQVTHDGRLFTLRAE